MVNPLEFFWAPDIALTWPAASSAVLGTIHILRKHLSGIFAPSLLHQYSNEKRTKVDPFEIPSPPTRVEGHLTTGLFNPKLQPQTFQPKTFQP